MNQTENVMFSLPSCVTIETVEALAGALKHLGLEPTQTLTIDASLVEIMTTPGIQMMLALHSTIHQSGGKLLLQNAGDAVVQSFQALGLQSQLAGWSEAQ